MMDLKTKSWLWKHMSIKCPLKMKKREKGFTLMEAIISITLGLMVAAIIMFIVPPGIKRLHQVKSLERLHSDAEFVISRLSFYIKKGKNISLSSPSTLEIEMPDSSLKTISKEGEEIKIDGMPFNSEEIRVTDLSFEKMARSVKVTLGLESIRTEENISLKTTISQRNNY